MLRIHAPGLSRGHGLQVRIDGQQRGVAYWGNVSDFAVEAGRHSVNIGGRLFHSKAFEFEDDGITPVDITFGWVPGRLLSGLLAFGSINIWRLVGEVTGLGWWACLFLVPTALTYVYFLTYRRFGGDPVVWRTGEIDPRVQARLVRRPLEGYPYSPEQIDPSIRSQYAAKTERLNIQTVSHDTRIRRVLKPLRGYPYRREQIEP